jgi:hypothetical protein
LLKPLKLKKYKKLKTPAQMAPWNKAKYLRLAKGKHGKARNVWSIMVTIQLQGDRGRNKIAEPDARK